jgi:hypothetical protein
MVKEFKINNFREGIQQLSDEGVGRQVIVEAR